MKINNKFIYIFLGLICSIIFFDFVFNKSEVALNEDEFTEIEVNKNDIILDNINILFGGDVMLDRSTRKSISKKGVNFLTENINEVFQNKDLIMVNLEGPVTSNKSVSNCSMDNPNHFKFTFDKEQTKKFFTFNNINSVGIGNNHILNFGEDGKKATEIFLKNNNIFYVDVPNVNDNNLNIKNIKGRKISFIVYNYSNKIDQDKFIERILKSKENSDFVVVYAHWGYEYKLQESDIQKKLAYKFIDAGADIIIGSHPHVVQPIEIYKNKVIFYSLGNLIFDQYFSQDVQERLLVNLFLEKDKVSFKLIPVYSDKSGQLDFMESERKNIFLNRIANDSSVDNGIKEKIKQGSFELNY